MRTYERFGYIYLSVFSAIFVAITNIPYYFISFEKNTILENVALLATNFLFTSLVFSLFSFSRYFYFLVNLVILCLNSGGAYFKAVYSISLSREAVESIFHANLNEIGSNFDHRIWVWGTLMGILPSVFLFKISKSIKFSALNWFKGLSINAAVIIIYILLSSGVAWHIKFYEKSLRSFMPYNYVISSIQYLKSRSSLQMAKNNPYLAENNENKNLVVVMIIGESARADHFSLNGYHRNTNPLLSKVENLLSFKDAYALATYTIGGVQSIFKNNTSSNDYSLLKLMELSNFKTFWFSNHRYENDIVTSIAKEANSSLFRDRILADNPQMNHDEVLFPYISDAINKSKEENLFIVLHTLGSHYSYDLRYPEDFLIFQPTCKEEHSFFGREHCEDRDKTINSYDNSILYTDKFIFDVMSLLQDRKALIIYISDHGESLGEEGIYFHTADFASAPKAQVHVPLLLWGTEKFLQDEKFKTNFDQAKSNLSSRITQHNIFHSLPHCLGLTKNIDQNKSICYKQISK